MPPGPWQLECQPANEEYATIDAERHSAIIVEGARYEAPNRRNYFPSVQQEFRRRRVPFHAQPHQDLAALSQIWPALGAWLRTICLVRNSSALIFSSRSRVRLFLVPELQVIDELAPARHALFSQFEGVHGTTGSHD